LSAAADDASTMRLLLQDAAHTDSLAAFLRTVGQEPVVAAPAELEVEVDPAELDVYLRVWRVLHPDAEVTVQA
jgi:hypothetical protein